MGYETASVLERLLIEQVILTWLHYHQRQYVWRYSVRRSR